MVDEEGEPIEGQVIEGAYASSTYELNGIKHIRLTPIPGRIPFIGQHKIPLNDPLTVQRSETIIVEMEIEETQTSKTYYMHNPHTITSVCHDHNEEIE